MNSPLSYLSISEAVNEVNILVGSFPVVVADCEDSDTDDSMAGCMDAELFCIACQSGNKVAVLNHHYYRLPCLPRKSWSSSCSLSRSNESIPFIGHDDRGTYMLDVREHDAGPGS
ncbi:hypothetical protein M404DRAFT_922343 [Pisolithus tinctorius Marx 270]|uniref:Uncharacterized protein n=1 Tax=Pisolithus tinctorius Marx 270 TaxID=870435 RepID=A0A0C3NNN0_PISTI|nr:hypothetical protein M404DRAFT_922343 [Pisolithus tinctorius Marx 270]